MNESCHIWMSHVTYEWVMSHMNESCHIWMSHVTYEWNLTHTELYHEWTSHVMYKCVMWWISYVIYTCICDITHSYVAWLIHMNESCHILIYILITRHMSESEWVMSHIESCHTYICVRDMTSHIHHATYERVMLCMTYTYVYHISYVPYADDINYVYDMYMTSLIHHATYERVVQRKNERWHICICVCDIPYWTYVRDIMSHISHISMTYTYICVCDITYWTYVCDMTYSSCNIWMSHAT